jgi:hypothetical protein
MGNLVAQAAGELDTSRNSRSAVSQSFTPDAIPAKKVAHRAKPDLLGF